MCSNKMMEEKAGIKKQNCRKGFEKNHCSMQHAVEDRRLAGTATGGTQAFII